MGGRRHKVCGREELVLEPLRFIHRDFSRCTRSIAAALPTMSHCKLKGRVALFQVETRPDVPGPRNGSPTISVLLKKGREPRAQVVQLNPIYLSSLLTYQSFHINCGEPSSLGMAGGSSACSKLANGIK